MQKLGALLLSMIMSKEIKEYSALNYVTPFALFKIKRDDSKKEHNMEYVLDFDKFFYNLKELNGKDLILADPVSATGGSLVTNLKYILAQGVTPNFNVISALKKSLRVILAIKTLKFKHYGWVLF